MLKLRPRLQILWSGTGNTAHGYPTPAAPKATSAVIHRHQFHS